MRISGANQRPGRVSRRAFCATRATASGRRRAGGVLRRLRGVLGVPGAGGERGGVRCGHGWIARLEIEAATQYVRALDAWDRRNLFGTPGAGGRRSRPPSTAPRASRRRYGSRSSHILRTTCRWRSRGPGSTVCPRTMPSGRSRVHRNSWPRTRARWRSSWSEAAKVAPAAVHGRRAGHDTARAWTDGRELASATEDQREVLFARLERTAFWPCARADGCRSGAHAPGGLTRYHPQ